MTQPPDPAVPKLLAGPLTRLRIALASGTTLALGLWLAPPVMQTVLSTSQEHVAPLLEEQVQRRETERAFGGVQEIAAGVRDMSVTVIMPAAPSQRSLTDYSQSSRTPRSTGFGVIVGDRQVLTHEDALAGRSSVEIIASTGTMTASVAAYEPSTGLVLLQTDMPAGTAVTMVDIAPMAGALAVGVGRGATGDLVLPMFITSVAPDRYVLGSVGRTVPPGLPVFSVAGEILGIASAGEETHALPIKGAVERLLSRVSVGARRFAIGVSLQSTTDLVPPLFGDRGVVVTEIVPGSPADGVEIQVGDVLLAIDDAATDSIDAVNGALIARGEPSPRRVRLRRGERTHEVTLTPAPAYEVAALARNATGVTTGPAAHTVFDKEALARASIPATAQVLAVNGRAVGSRSQVERQRRAARSALSVLVRDAGEQYFVALEPE